MISYKTWKLLQENLGYTNLGVKSANIVGSVNEAPGLFGMMKKAKKPMPDEDPGMAPDMGGADATDDDDMGGDEEDHDHDDMGDDEEGDDMGGDEEDHDHDEEGDDMGGDEEGEDGPPPPPMGKKKKPPMGDMGGGDMGAKPPMMMKKEGKDAVDEKDKKQNSANGVDMLKYKQKGKCSKCKMMAKEEKEEDSFLAKLRDMTGGTKFAKDEEGYWVPVDEDTLIAPEVNNEPAAGEVGYAPTQKIGDSVAGSFTEWATNHVKKTRKK